MSRGRTALVLLGTATAGALVALLLATFLTGDGSPDPGAGRSALPTPGTADPAFGVFRESVPERVAEFGEWAGRDVEYVVDYSSRDTWADVSSPTYLLDIWRGVDVRLVLGVAMLPTEDPSATIARGAAGDYDGYFTDLARLLVAEGRQDSVIRLGWEFNLRESRWSDDDAEAWVAYWRRIVTAMRAVPGQQLAFDWNPSNGSTPYDAVDYYPGDDVVDVVGVDAYDATGATGTYPYPSDCDAACRTLRQDRAWEDRIYGGARGLRFWSDFAVAHRKPMSLPEWGLWDRPDGAAGGENPRFITRMHAFVTDPVNDVLYHAYFEFDGDDGRHRLMTSFPESGEVFRDLFGRDPR